jgi:hypothetical protein
MEEAESMDTRCGGSFDNGIGSKSLPVDSIDNLLWLA